MSIVMNPQSRKIVCRFRVARVITCTTWFNGLVVMISVSHCVHRRSPVRSWIEPFAVIIFYFRWRFLLLTYRHDFIYGLGIIFFKLSLTVFSAFKFFGSWHLCIAIMMIFPTCSLGLHTFLEENIRCDSPISLQPWFLPIQGANNLNLTKKIRNTYGISTSSTQQPPHLFRLPTSLGYVASLQSWLSWIPPDL